MVTLTGCGNSKEEVQREPEEVYIDALPFETLSPQYIVVTTSMPTATPTPIPWPTATLVPTATPVPMVTPIPIWWPTATPVPTATLVPTATPILIWWPTATPVPTATPTPIPWPTATPVPTATLVPTPTPTPTSTPIPTPTSTPTPTPTPKPTVNPGVVNLEKIRDQLTKMNVANEIIPDTSGKRWDLYQYIDTNYVEPYALYDSLKNIFVNCIAHSVEITFSYDGNAEDRLQRSLQSAKCDLCGNLKMTYNSANTSEMGYLMSQITDVNRANYIMLDFLYEHTAIIHEPSQRLTIICGGH